jgi:hypothetical protein
MSVLGPGHEDNFETLDWLDNAAEGSKDRAAGRIGLGRIRPRKKHI